MSRATEIAEREADEAEREHLADDEIEAEQEAEVEPETEPDAADTGESAPEPSSATVTSDLDKRLTAESKRHTTALEKAYGQLWPDRFPCPLCETEGFLTPWPEGSMPDDQAEAVAALAGTLTGPELKADPRSIRCEACDGWGDVSTGARREVNATAPCPACSGKGYQNEADRVSATFANGQPPTLAYVPPPAFPVTGELDQWNRPAGHPHFGIDPVYVGVG